MLSYVIVTYNPQLREDDVGMRFRWKHAISDFIRADPDPYPGRDEKECMLCLKAKPH
jgi:hypothetical protein